jgi:hypothetical protein
MSKNQFPYRPKVEDRGTKAFTWPEEIQRVLSRKIERAKIRARQGSREHKLKHPGEVTAAVAGNYASLIARVKREFDAEMYTIQQRKDKYAGKIPARPGFNQKSN